MRSLRLRSCFRRAPRSGLQQCNAAGPGLSASFPFTWPDRCMAVNLGLEVPQARPIEPFAQVNFSYGHRPPIFGLSDDMAFPIEDRRLHPMLYAIGVSAADDEHVVLASAGLCKQRIAPGDRE